MKRLTLVLLLAAASCTRDPHARVVTRDAGPLLRELEIAGPLPRRWAARLSIAVADMPCGGADSLPYASLDCPSAGAGAALTPTQIAVAAKVATAMRGSLNTDALHAAALLEMIVADTARNALDQSVSYLEMITRLAPPTTEVLTDLAAAHLARAARWHDARELLASLDASSRALEIDSLSSAALYNRTLALQELSLDSQAEQATTAYLRSDSASTWAMALSRERHTRRARVNPTWPLVDQSDSSLRAFARRAPVAALTAAWEDVLGEWGRAVRQRDDTLARGRLHAARVIADVLAELGDHSSADGVRHIENAISADRIGQTFALRQLAQSHAELAQAQQLRRTNRYEDAEELFNALRARAIPSHPLRLWVASDAANNALSRSRPDLATPILEQLKRDASVERYPAIAGRARWSLGLIELRRNKAATAIAQLREARQLFARIGFDEYTAWMWGMEGEVHLQAGDDATGHAGSLEALRLFRHTPRAVGRHNTLFILANAATASGMQRAAMAFQDEDRDANGFTGTPITVAETQLSRARVLLGQQRANAASAAMHATDSAIAAIPDTLMRNRLHHELGTLRGQQLIATEPVRAQRILDSTVAVLEPLGNAAKTLPALITRAYVNVALNDDEAANADLKKAADLYLMKASYLGTEPDARKQRLALVGQRQVLLNLARPVFDSLVLRRLRRGDANADIEALATFERWRHALAVNTAFTLSPNNGSTTRGPALAYAVFGDELVIWVGVNGSLRAHRVRVRRDTLAALVERARLALEQADETTTRETLTRLYDLLIRPVAHVLGPSGATVRLMLDDAISNVPFAALYDSTRKEYFVARHASQVARHWNGSEASTATAGTRAAFKSVSIVESPAFDQAAFPTLSALPNARIEVDAIAREFARARVLRGARADRSGVRAALEASDLFHFAGHAVLDDARPERSALVLGSRGVTATEISQLDLRGLRVAVLSACETSRRAEQGGAGFGELTTAFLLAGAQGVVGTLWRAEDASTARFVASFYQRMAVSRDVARALRDAQVAMTERPPWEWAAFRYVVQ